MAVAYPTQVSCKVEGCVWTHDAVDEDDAIDAWEAHQHSGCPAAPRRASADGGPADPIGTVRAGVGVLAVRAHSANPDYADDLVWFVIDIGGDIDPEHAEAAIATWPIVYQP